VLKRVVDFGPCHANPELMNNGILQLDHVRCTWQNENKVNEDRTKLSNRYANELFAREQLLTLPTMR
jgi:hypothetical protein